MAQQNLIHYQRTYPNYHTNDEYSRFPIPLIRQSSMSMA